MVGRVEGAPAYTRRFWAKADRQAPERIHLLEHHLADVGACFEALLDQPIIRHRLARTAGRDHLDDATTARLAVFAALHDIGKVNVGFQAQIWRKADVPAGQRTPRRTATALRSRFPTPLSGSLQLGRLDRLRRGLVPVLRPAGRWLHHHGPRASKVPLPTRG